MKGSDRKPAFRWHCACHPCDICGQYGEGSPFTPSSASDGWHDLLMIYTAMGRMLEICDPSGTGLGSRAKPPAAGGPSEHVVAAGGE